MSTQWRELSRKEQNRIVGLVKLQLRGDDWPGWEVVAKNHGLTGCVGLRYRCDPDYAERRKEYQRKERPRGARPKRGAKHFTETYGPRSDHHVRGGPVMRDIAARLAEIPEDTRSPAQRLCGDPIPGDDRRGRYG